MRRIIKSLTKRINHIRNLGKQVKKQGAYPAGHYYSPIPAEEDVLAYVNTRKPPGNDLPGIDLNAEKQHQTLDEYIEFYKDLPFPEKKTPGHRYYYENNWFSYSDAIFLYSFLRKNTPNKIIEVGSGFSSAVMLDTVERFFPNRPEITFIEPYPDRLLSLFKEGDRQKTRLIDKKIQEVEPAVLLALEPGDLLFIDSSHVVKCGSDLQFLMFDILPHLRPGVFVHFHDVFYPFDYPSRWLLEGRYWNENYLLRAFLSYNLEWSIEFFNTYAHLRFGDLIREKMPLCARNTGGSLYIKREIRD
jgi:predicted O-methyltransferase YrrM